MNKQLRARNNMVWGEIVFFHLNGKRIDAHFDSSGLATIDGKTTVSEGFANYIRQIDGEGKFYYLTDEDEAMEDEKKMAKDAEENPRYEGDEKHGVDSTEHSSVHLTTEGEKIDRESHGRKAETGTPEQVREEDAKHGVDTEKRDSLLGDSENAKHGIAPKERDPRVIDREDDASHGVDTAKRDAVPQLNSSEREQHGVSPDAPVSSARDILGDDPRDELAVDAARESLKKNPRTTLRVDTEQQILKKDTRDDLKSTPRKKPKAPEKEA